MRALVAGRLRLGGRRPHARSHRARGRRRAVVRARRDRHRPGRRGRGAAGSSSWFATSPGSPRGSRGNESKAGPGSCSRATMHPATGSTWRVPTSDPFRRRRTRTRRSRTSTTASSPGRRSSANSRTTRCSTGTHVNCTIEGDGGNHFLGYNLGPFVVGPGERRVVDVAICADRADPAALRERAASLLADADRTVGDARASYEAFDAAEARSDYAFGVRTLRHYTVSNVTYPIRIGEEARTHVHARTAVGRALHLGLGDAWHRTC